MDTRQAVGILFGRGGLGADQVPNIATHDSPPASPALSATPRTNQGWSYLTPFKPKADTAYFTRIVGGAARRTRTHETLVNSCAQWLAGLGLMPGRNAAIDLGVAELNTIIEAKTVERSWSDAIREAVGQLYEYRYYKVADPTSSLIFMADRPVPDLCVEYLEKDRVIGVMWPDPRDFHTSDWHVSRSAYDDGRRARSTAPASKATEI
jgi:hypothetical protein